MFIRHSFFTVDETRVKLQDADANVPGSDYINANYIRWKADDPANCDGDVNTKVYIATQGRLLLKYNAYNSTNNM